MTEGPELDPGSSVLSGPVCSNWIWIWDKLRDPKVIGFKKLIFWLHLICGISMGLVVFTMSATGVILTYEKQIIRWADGFDVQPPSPDACPLGPEALLGKAFADTGKRPTSVQFRSDRSEPARIGFGRESVAVDPYTGTAFGACAVGVRGFFRTMILWHRWLGQEGDSRAVSKASRELATSGSYSSSSRASTFGGRRSGPGNTFGLSSSSGVGLLQRPGTSTGTTFLGYGVPSRYSSLWLQAPFSRTPRQPTSSTR